MYQLLLQMLLWSCMGLCTLFAYITVLSIFFSLCLLIQLTSVNSLNMLLLGFLIHNDRDPYNLYMAKTNCFNEIV